ncbi:adenosylcobinamide-phosphate synthase CbiB [Cyanobium sp. BA5m-21]|uniref:adenosylcobinamide-phosphate synthase CbiB n=1 Tax=Cyanobium sp. BA5m-21 TaxID=2823706 RepID=UPI0039656F4E
MAMAPLVLVALACGLDRLVGDPRGCIHPVVVMGWLISRLRGWAERWAANQPRRLRLAGVAITALLVGGSGLAGWGTERLAWSGPLGAVLLVVALASALAGRSLEQAVGAVLASVAACDLPLARQRLSWIVGRDTADLDAPEILRALAETASENAVDGLFAPLFWMLLGAGLWSLNPAWPGPLALAWGFKAASTLDSMLGYRRGRLRWLGTAGARLDDLLVWLPCRLVAVSLPLAAGQPGRSLEVLAAARRDGAADPSPNAGLSQAAYAHVAGVQLGGSNSYGGQMHRKPLLAAGLPAPDQAAVLQMLQLNRRLELIWLTAAAAVAFITKTLS